VSNASIVQRSFSMNQPRQNTKFVTLSLLLISHLKSKGQWCKSQPTSWRKATNLSMSRLLFISNYQSSIRFMILGIRTIPSMLFQASLNLKTLRKVFFPLKTKSITVLTHLTMITMITMTGRFPLTLIRKSKLRTFHNGTLTWKIWMKSKT